MTNNSMNQVLRQAAGMPPAATAPTAPRAPKGNAGNGCAPAAGMPTAPSMNQWLQAAARGRAKAEVITITGSMK